MKTKIEFDGITSTKALQESILRRMEFGFGAHGERIEVVKVRLAEVNEPREGKDKSCEVKALLSAGQTVMVKIMDSDIHLAIHRAVDRASWTVARSLQREQRLANAMLISNRNSFGHSKPVRATSVNSVLHK